MVEEKTTDLQNTFKEEFETVVNNVNSAENDNIAWTAWGQFMDKYESFVRENKEYEEQVLEFINTNECILRLYTEISNKNSKSGEAENSESTGNDETSEEDVSETSSVNLDDYVPKEEFDNLNDKYQRLLSEFDNYKKRTIKEKSTLVKTANEKLVIDTLSTLDDFDRASQTQGGLSEGMQITYKNLLKTLEKHGAKVVVVDSQKFDADRMFAISEIPVEEQEKKGMVINVIEKGYSLGDKIIRFPKVVIGK